MKHHAPCVRRAAACVLVALLAFSPLLPGDSSEREATRDTMSVIFDNLRFLLETDLADESLDDPVGQNAVLGALRELDDQSAILAAHGFSEDPAGVFLAGVLERFTLLMLRSFEQGQRERYRELLYGITDVCIACHTRLPSPGDSPTAGAFADSDVVDGLPPYRRARLQIATRRFDDALETLESIIETDEPADPVLLEVAIRDHLGVSIRVKGDMERPVPLLESVQARGRPGSRWEQDVGSWIASLNRYAEMPYIVDLLATARDIVAIAERGGDERHRGELVDYLAASSLLHRFLASAPGEPLQVSEAYYLLGLCEYRIDRDDWLPQAELFLEVAIVLAPDAPWSEDAYDMLAEKIRRTYRSSPEVLPPPEVEQRLRELREAIDGDRPSSAQRAPGRHGPIA